MMARPMDIDRLFDMPGGDDFEDVTDFFVAAANDMESEHVLLTDGFTLFDAMAALEIGEPRMDTGIIPMAELRPPFDPLAPLLPEEICWILDRSFACEMDWHTGNALAQTIYTFLYIHHVADISHEFLPNDLDPMTDPSRPRELITVVLRAVVLGLLKSCDLAWRQLSSSRDSVYDNEDWISEKSEVTLHEGIPFQYVLQNLDDASRWLYMSILPRALQDALHDRLQLRKCLLQLFSLQLQLPDALSQLSHLTATARQILDRIRTSPIPTPHPDSPAFLAFDPKISRHLHALMPIRVLNLSDQKDAWSSLETMLTKWEEIGYMSLYNPSTWEFVGFLHAWSPSHSLSVPYLRSLAQTVFVEKNSASGSKQLAESWFEEILGVRYDDILQTILHSWADVGEPPIKELERRIMKLYSLRIKSAWYNPPRRRRYLAKSIVEWHDVYDTLLQITCQLTTTSESVDLIASIPKVALHWRLSAMREVILSGFQQELYRPDERAIAYCYTAQVIEVHLSCLDELIPLIPRESTQHDQLLSQHAFLTIIQKVSTAMCVITSQQMTSSEERMSLNFVRRFKWAFHPGYDEIDALALPLPDFEYFRFHIFESSISEDYAPSEALRDAHDLALLTAQSKPLNSWSGQWIDDWRTFLLDLATICERLSAVAPQTAQEASSFDIKKLRWDPCIHPWFPGVV